MKLLEAIGRQVHDLRKARGMTQEELGAACGLPTSYIGSIERAKKNLTINTLERVADALDVAASELVAGRELHEQREVEALLNDVPSRIRPRLLQVLRTSVVMFKDLAAEVQSRR